MSRKKQKNRQESAEERTFMGDLAGGLTAAVVALPLALAFGMASGLGASAGLYGAIITGLIAAIAGGTPVQITGPTGPITMLLAGVVATHGEGGVSFALLAMFLAGSFQILFGLLGLGKVIRFVPSSVVSGFMTGIGLLLIQQQYEPLLDPGEGHAVSITLGVGMITALLVYIAPRIHRSIPGSLAALVLVTTGTVLLEVPLPRVGELPSGFPSFGLPAFDLPVLREAIFAALTLAFLGSIDTLLTSIVCDQVTHSQHDPRRELLGQGVANLTSSCFGALMGAGATVRSLVNVRSGGRSRLSGVLCALFLLVMVLFFRDAASQVPLAVLAGILMTVGIGMIDVPFFKSLKRMPWEDALIMLSTSILTVTAGLIDAVLAGILLSAAVMLKRASVVGLELVPPEALSVRERELVNEMGSRFVKFRITGPLFFGSSPHFIREVAHATRAEIILLNMAGVSVVDLTGLQSLQTVIVELHDGGHDVFLAEIQKKVKPAVRKFGILDDVGEDKVFEHVEDAIAAAAGRLRTPEA